MNDKFRKFAHNVSSITGTPYAFAFSVLIIISWALMGPFFKYSDTWQLVINTGTTIITFLMVFLIQNTQNRDNRALQTKLDELIRANKHARNQLIDLEDLNDKELDEIHKELCLVHEQTANKLKHVRQKLSQVQS